MIIKFDAWKAEYQPRIIDEPNTECDEHPDEEGCACDYLYPTNREELADYDETALAEQRVWTWFMDGPIVSGIHGHDEWLLVTRKPWTESTTVD
jgi:hypothetical protein